MITLGDERPVLVCIFEDGQPTRHIRCRSTEEAREVSARERAEGRTIIWGK